MTVTLPEPPYTLDTAVKKQLDPEYIEFFGKHLTTNANILYTHLVPLEQIRAGGNVIPGQSPLLPVGKTEDIAVPRRADSEETSAKAPATIPVRYFYPSAEAIKDVDTSAGLPCMVWFHGGGWVLGNIGTENSMCTHMAEWSKCVVISVDYRLAPENPFPACIHDSYDALLWVYENAAKLGVDPTRIAVGGASAGGNISAVLAHKIASDPKTAHLPPLVLQLLFVPACDNTADVDTHASWKTFEHTPQLPRDKMMWYRRLYLPNKEDWTNPEASPIFYSDDSFKKVCRAEVIVAGCDVLSSEGEIYAQKLQKNGVETKFKSVPGVPHPVMAMDAVLSQGAKLVKETTDDLRRVFYP